MNNTANLKPYLIVTMLFAVFFHANTALTETFYKWVDQDGVTHYGSEPPTEQSTTKIRVTGQTKNDATRGKSVKEVIKKNAQELKTAQEQKNQSATKALNDAELAKKKQAGCEQAKKNVDTLNTSARVREKDADGNFKYLAPEEHQKRIKETQEYLSNHCGTP